MIIYVLIILAILFFLSWNLFLSKRWIHVVTSIISTVLLLVAIGFSIANFNHHYGMHLVNHTHTEKLASVTKQAPMMMYEKLGSAKKHEIVVYKHTNNGKRLHTYPDSHVKDEIHRTNSNHAYLKQTHRLYEYKSNSARLWFGIAQKKQWHATVNKFYVPKKWTVLSAQQAQVMTKAAKQAGAKANNPQAKAMLKQKSQAYVKAQVMKAMQKNPKISKAQQKKITKRAVKEFKSQMKQQAAAKLMPQAIKKAKAAPEGYANK